jgi:hypothetical protein
MRARGKDCCGVSSGEHVSGGGLPESDARGGGGEGIARADS